MSANSGSGSTSRLSYTSGMESDGEFIDSTPTPRASRNTLTGPPTMIPTPQSTAALNLQRCNSDPNLVDDDVTDDNGEKMARVGTSSLTGSDQTDVRIPLLSALATFPRKFRRKDPRLQCAASLRGLARCCPRWAKRRRRQRRSRGEAL